MRKRAQKSGWRVNETLSALTCSISFESLDLVGWPPRVRKRPLSEIALWITGSPASWRVSQTPECNGLLTATRGVFMITPQRQPGKFACQRNGRTPGLQG